MNCESYAGAFVNSTPGYLKNPMATTDCQYCQFTTGNDYLATLSIDASDKWRDFGIFLMFVCTNWMLVYFFIYTVRVKGWSFGFGTLFGGLGKAVDVVKKPMKRVMGKKRE